MTEKILTVEDRYIKYVSTTPLKTSKYITSYLSVSNPVKFYYIEHQQFITQYELLDYVHLQLKICSNNKDLFEAFVEDILVTFFWSLLIDFNRQIDLLSEYSNKFVSLQTLLCGNNNIQFTNGQLSILYLQVEDSRIQYIIDRYVNFILMSDLLQFKINVIEVIEDYILYTISYNTNNIVISTDCITSNIDKLDIITILETMGIKIKHKMSDDDLVKVLHYVTSTSFFRKLQLYYYINRVHEKSIEEKFMMTKVPIEINTLDDLFEHFDTSKAPASHYVWHNTIYTKKNILNKKSNTVLILKANLIRQYESECEACRKRILVEREEYQTLSKYCKK